MSAENSYVHISWQADNTGYYLIKNMGEELHITDELLLSRILDMRGCKVMIDHDLAELYGVTTKRLNEQVKRNHKRFPLILCFG